MKNYFRPISMAERHPAFKTRCLHEYEVKKDLLPKILANEPASHLYSNTSAVGYERDWGRKLARTYNYVHTDVENKAELQAELIDIEKEIERREKLGIFSESQFLEARALEKMGLSKDYKKQIRAHLDEMHVDTSLLSKEHIGYGMNDHHEHHGQIASHGHDEAHDEHDDHHHHSFEDFDRVELRKSTATDHMNEIALMFTKDLNQHIELVSNGRWKSAEDVNKDLAPLDFDTLYLNPETEKALWESIRAKLVAVDGTDTFTIPSAKGSSSDLVWRQKTVAELLRPGNAYGFSRDEVTLLATIFQEQQADNDWFKHQDIGKFGPAHEVPWPHPGWTLPFDVADGWNVDRTGLWWKVIAFVSFSISVPGMLMTWQFIKNGTGA